MFFRFTELTGRRVQASAPILHDTLRRNVFTWGSKHCVSFTFLIWALLRFLTGVLRAAVMKQINVAFNQNSLSKDCGAAVGGTHMSAKRYFIIESICHHRCYAKAFRWMVKRRKPSTAAHQGYKAVEILWKKYKNQTWGRKKELEGKQSHFTAQYKQWVGSHAQHCCHLNPVKIIFWHLNNSLS